MKKLYPFIALLFLCINSQAQVTATTQLTLDYDGLDDQYSSDNGFQYQRYVWNVNSRFPNSDDLNLRYAAVKFDTLAFLDLSNARTFYPKAATTLVLDSFDAFFIHQHNTANADSIRFTVFNTIAVNITGYGTPAATFTTPPIWDTLIVANSTIPLTTSNFTVMTFHPGITLPQGQTFGIRVDFAGDTANQFQVLAGYRDDCAGACQSEVGIVGNNSCYYLNFTQAGTPFTNYSGYYENSSGLGPALLYDCDQSGGYTIGGCENFPLQNFVFPTYVSATVDYGVVIVPQATTGCAANTVTLNANAFGSAATPYTYNWATSSGNLTSVSDQSVDLILSGSNATVSVTVTDANNVTTTGTRVITPGINGINISISSANPLTLVCGTPGTITTQVSGTTAGAHYVWNTGAGTPSLQVNSAGNYEVTVTNSSGCSATASATVQYPGGLHNIAGFNLPSPPYCEDIPQTFINTSQRLTGWNSTWNFGDGNVGFSINGTNVYTSPGVYSVSLTIDSLGCSFYSNTSTITILAATNGLCINPGLTVSLGQNQTACSGSTVTLNPTTTNGTPPYTYNWSNTANDLSCGTCDNPVTTITLNATYSVTVVDALNHTAAAAVNYTVSGTNNTMQLSTTNQPITCTNAGSNTQLTVTGGTAPFTFHWSSTSSNTGTSPGTHGYTQAGVYVISVADAAGCTSSIADTVTYLGINISAAQMVHPACEHMNTGKIKITASAGTAPYTYLWSDNTTADSITNAAPYNYTVIVTDATSCTASALFQLSPSNGWGYHVFVAGTNANCGNTGQVTSTVSGGLTPFNYTWSNNATTPTITGLGAGNYSLTVTDNAGCSTTGISSIAANCVSIISGMVFDDANGNCNYDAGDATATGMYIVASGASGMYYGCTTNSGHYSIEVPNTGTYFLNAYTGFYGVPCGNLTLCGNSSHSITITTAGDSSDNNNFAFVGGAGFDLNIHPGWSPGNPGFTKDYWVYCGNQSSVPVTGQATVTFNYDSNLIYESSYPVAHHDLARHSLTWVVDSFSTNNGFWDNYLHSTFLVPQTLTLTDMLYSNFFIGPTVGDCDSSNNALVVVEMVTGSRDPNEKEVEPAGKILETDTMLTYTIHFQNNGTDSTHFIIVTDTLSHSLDPVSVRTVASSHPYSEFNISGEGILKWTFNPLRLVDSLTNEEGSKGFIKFTVKKRNNLPIGSVISNKAHIYFDYNEPVVTNTVQDTMSLPNYIFEARSNDGVSVKAFPNPFSDATSIVVEGLETKFDFDLYDLTGSLHKRITAIETSKFELQRDALSAGVYFYRIVTATGKGAYGKLVVQ